MRKAIITGASSGLGLEVARLLQEKGVKVINLSRSKTDFQDLYADLAEDKTIFSAIKAIKKQHADFDLLILNAGVYLKAEMGKFDFESDYDVDKNFRVNITGSMKLVNGLISLMKKNHADIVVVGSTSAFKNSEEVVYTATKQAVLSFIRSLQAQLKHEDVRVIGFHPGRFNSNLRGKNVVKEGSMDAKDLAVAMLNALSLPRSMEVSEIIINRKERK